MQNKVAENKKVLTTASKIAKAVELELEQVLEDMEYVVKKHFPAKYVKLALTSLEKKLSKEGIETKFDKVVTRESIRESAKTAKAEITAQEVKEAVDFIMAAVVEEFEDVLKDTDEFATDEVKGCDGDKTEIEGKLKSVLEKKLASIGINCRLARRFRKPKTASKKVAVKKQSKQAKQSTTMRVRPAKK